ncbi:response regulator transcription factor [Flavobacterium sp. xlx-214]|uniref:LytR/AlgR family response regulator transcription factor n=1 Tax=unclassified Flavobacterium TaxID=196869 RepID=UPI0013D3484B|nr:MULTISPECIES: LytTR family DNA-binding domain-containing protein [unclassified Flavobacterium]MBA5792344.1 response regulator transcription factor [Flavobacterium sp. xlx-221]QMI82341.1 response regulator transcription factor [Flavobacterium sp. xlx-214]
MNSLVIVIIDDEPKAREVLKSYINILIPDNKFEYVSCNSVKEGAEAIEKYYPDLVFLDIEMPEANGFELFDKVKKDSFEVVFVTAFSQYLEKSVNDIGCFGYLYKPLEREKLLRIFERFQEKAIEKKYLKFINSAQNKRVMIELNDIVFCKASNNYCELFMKDGKSKYVLSKTLKNIEAELPETNFLRVHRTFLVNTHHIVSFTKEDNTLELNHFNEDWDQNIPVSESSRKVLRSLFL